MHLVILGIDAFVILITAASDTNGFIEQSENHDDEGVVFRVLCVQNLLVLIATDEFSSLQFLITKVRQKP